MTRDHGPRSTHRINHVSQPRNGPDKPPHADPVFEPSSSRDITLAPEIGGSADVDHVHKPSAEIKEGLNPLQRNAPLNAPRNSAIRLHELTAALQGSSPGRLRKEGAGGQTRARPRGER